jgi:hypothetical protein
MNKIRIRVAMTPDKMNHIQVSTDNLVWFTVSSTPDGLEAIEKAKALVELASNCFINPTHILWKSKV